MSDTEISSPTHYEGNCHCGQIRFDLNLHLPLRHVFTCRCSMCSKKGYLWVFPEESQFQITIGQQAMIKYSADGLSGEHYFCPKCGTAIMAQNHVIENLKGESKIAVNARALNGVNPFTLETKVIEYSFDSASVSHPFPGKLPIASDDDLKLHTGGCYCGAVTVAVKLKPLSEVEIKEDNCSICQRNANIYIYPHRDSVSIHGLENVTEYLFSRKFNGHCFCRVCGVHVFIKLHGPPKSVVDSLPVEKQKYVQDLLAIFPVRLSVLDDIEWSDCHVKRSDEGTAGYEI